VKESKSKPTRKTLSARKKAYTTDVVWAPILSTQFLTGPIHDQCNDYIPISAKRQGYKLLENAKFSSYRNGTANHAKDVRSGYVQISNATLTVSLNFWIKIFIRLTVDRLL